MGARLALTRPYKGSCMGARLALIRPYKGSCMGARLALIRPYKGSCMGARWALICQFHIWVFGQQNKTCKYIEYFCEYDKKDNHYSKF